LAENVHLIESIIELFSNATVIGQMEAGKTAVDALSWHFEHCSFAKN
jgi:hypothetical protein